MSKLRFIVMLTVLAVLSGIIQGAAKSALSHFFGADSILVKAAIQAACNVPVLFWACRAAKRLK